MVKETQRKDTVDTASKCFIESCLSRDISFTPFLFFLFLTSSAPLPLENIWELLVHLGSLTQSGLYFVEAGGRIHKSPLEQIQSLIFRHSLLSVLDGKGKPEQRHR